MKKFILATLAVAFSIGIFAFARADQNENNNGKPPINYKFRFQGTSLSQASEADQYVQITTPTNPSCAAGNTLPCRLEFQSEITDPEEAIQEHLDNLGSDQAILVSAVAKRN